MLLFSTTGKTNAYYMCTMEKNISKEIWMQTVHHSSSTELKAKDIAWSQTQ